MEEAKASHFVFVHGAMHGAWCWYKIRSRLESAGHKASCLDLSGAGIDPADPNTISDLSQYNKPLTDFMSNLPDDEKVILVGHSAGGLSVTRSIQEFGNKIHTAVYVAALMLPFQTQSSQKNIWEYEYALGPDKPPTSIILKSEFQREFLFNLSPKEDSTLASMLLRPFPVMVFKELRFSCEGDMDKVKRVYIKTMHDRILTPDKQDELIEMWPPSKVLTMETDHSPFFSDPAQLINLLFEATAHE